MTTKRHSGLGVKVLGDFYRSPFYSITTLKDILTFGRDTSYISLPSGRGLVRICDAIKIGTEAL
jgi:hypothetical protein